MFRKRLSLKFNVMKQQNNETKSSEDISEEDKRLQEELNMLVEKLCEKDEKLYHPALECLRDLIRTSTTSMTSVPKPLKYLRNHYNTIKEVYLRMRDPEVQKFCADIISVLAMTQLNETDQAVERDCLKYCLLGTKSDVGDWGHEYVRQLESEIAEEWILITKERNVATKAQLLSIVDMIVSFDMSHNAEIQACDLLMEIDEIDRLRDYIDTSNYSRVCLYLISCALYVDKPEYIKIINLVLDFFLKFREYTRAMCLAMNLNDCKLMTRIFESCQDESIRKQLAFLLGRQQVVLDLDEFPDGSDLKTVMSNAHINDHFLNMARELDIMEPKTPEDVYKTWLENLVMRPTFLAESNIDSARKNLASTFVNAFVNTGFGTDKLVTGEDGKNWIYRNKEHGKMSAAASLGLIHLWDVDGGLSPIDRYLYGSDDYIKSGALLALGIVNCGVRNECDPAQALLMDYVLHSSNTLRIGSILGLGLAYAGSCRQDVVELIVPVLSDSHSTREVVAIAALACSLITVGFGSGEVTSPILQALMDMGPEDLENTYARFLPLALGICYLGQKDAIEATSATLEVLPEPFRSMAQTMLQICAYAGTGDVLVIQELLHICSEHYSQEEKYESISRNIEKKESKKNVEGEKNQDLSSMQGVATLGVALIAMGEEIGNEMSTRIFGNLGRYGESSVRKAVPLAIALSSLSNPVLAVCDVLNKYSHDIDEEVAYNAVLCMGLVGAGTNNARLVTMLRHLAQYHVKNPTLLFMVRLAQGLVHMGKGTLSLSPFHSDHQIMSPVALSGLLVVLVACLDVKNLILGQSHYLLYCLVTAIQPRWLVTLDEELCSLAVPVRVGQAVDVVGKAGTPKTITGTNTHNTPVLLAIGERAELATEEYIPLSPMLEGIVILRKNPVVA